MATKEFNKSAALVPVSIGCNSIGTITLEDCEPLHEFAALHSERLASLLMILQKHHQDIDGGFMSDMLGLANDMAYQVQQAVKFLADEKAGA